MADPDFELLLDEFQSIYGEQHEIYRECKEALILDLENALKHCNILHVPITARVKRWDRASATAERRQKLRREACEIRKKLGPAEWQKYCKKWNISDSEAKVFETGQDIFNAMHDLLGARIAVYFPDDVAKIELLLRDAGFEIVRRLPKGGMKDLQRLRLLNEKLESGDVDEEARMEKAFSGYGATHLVVRLPQRLTDKVDRELRERARREINDPYYATMPPSMRERHEKLREQSKRIRDGEFWYDAVDAEPAPVVAEIQIGTVVMHAWAEVEHDIIYKQLGQEKPSEDEERILDLINGIVITGEVALRQLQATRNRQIEHRANRDDAANEVQAYIQDQHELGERLAQYSTAHNLQGPRTWPGLKELFLVLRSLDRHRHHDLTRELDEALQSDRGCYLDGMLPLHLLARLCKPAPLADLGPDLEPIEKARILALRLINTCNVVCCMEKRFQEAMVANLLKYDAEYLYRPSVIDFLDLVHPKRPQCRPGVENVMIAFCQRMLDHSDWGGLEQLVESDAKELQLRIQIAIGLASNGFSAYSVLCNESAKAWMPHSSGFFIPHWLLETLPVHLRREDMHLRTWYLDVNSLYRDRYSIGEEDHQFWPMLDSQTASSQWRAVLGPFEFRLVRGENQYPPGKAAIRDAQRSRRQKGRKQNNYLDPFSIQLQYDQALSKYFSRTGFLKYLGRIPQMDHQEEQALFARFVDAQSASRFYSPHYSQYHYPAMPPRMQFGYGYPSPYYSPNLSRGFDGVGTASSMAPPPIPADPQPPWYPGAYGSSPGHSTYLSSYPPPGAMHPPMLRPTAPPFHYSGSRPDSPKHQGR